MHPLIHTLIYGGTFDPPHLGHLNTAIAIQKQLHFERFLFLPCKTPVLKNEPHTSPSQRIHMLKLMLSHHKTFQIDTREITRDSPSYMTLTLASFRKELGEGSSITLCLGMDVFLQLPTWFSFETILTQSNLLVLHRENIAESPLKPPLQDIMSAHETFNLNDLLTHPFGKIYRFDAGRYSISSSQIRSAIQAGQGFEATLSRPVALYIKQHGLYLSNPESAL